MKKYILSLCLLLSLTSLLSPVQASALQAPSQTAFHDISASFAKDAIDRLAKRGIVSGDGTGAFLPRKPVTRAEFTAMIARMLKLEPVQNDVSAFRDVSKSAWYYGWIHTGLNLSIVQGNGFMFYPNAPITRQEAAVIVTRAMKQNDVYHGNTAGRYLDAVSIAKWAWDAVGTATDTGWLQGSKGQFRPQDAITREETAKLLDRVLQSGNVKTSVDRQVPANIHMGWLYNGTTKEYISYAKRAGLNVLVPRWYYMESNGKVSDHTDQALLTWARSNGRQVWAMVGNRGNAEGTHSVLSSAQNRKSVVESIAANVSKYQLDGINIDFENVMAQDRQNLTAFITQLSAEMKRLGAKLSIDVSPDLNTDWTAAFDYAALGRQVDYVVLMSYDQHWGGSPKAGSVSSLPWSESALNKLINQVTAKKSIVAYPLYTRDWQLASSVSSQDISLIEQGHRIRLHKASLAWNADVAQYEAAYTIGGVRHRIWTEEARSLSMKHLMAAKYQIAGYAYWYPGAETTDVWQAINNAERYASYSFRI
ncbi:S-layer homology domain-containing protein [Paenibacillus glucanolyticus]|uniref:S-layer homology domain-containing protein n=1 Tax=Paenibacillus TaxID=44249 RepID=UPI002476C5B6|nr:S-layer homology domain-containing protein [Paenibacillus sp. LBL]MDH6670461.1 spore germination protein YaaH [Paenibacillus sp. LBL]